LHYGPFIALHMPVLGLGSLAVTVGMALLLFRDRLQPRATDEAAAPFTADARRLSILLLLTLILWATDSLHGIAPAWVGLGAALLMILPGIALVPADALRKDMDYGPWLFVAGAISLGAIVEHSGLGGQLSHVVLRAADFHPGDNALNFAKILAINTAVANVIAVSGAPAVLTPLAADIAQATGWPLLSVLMTQVIANAAILLPYQGPSVLVGITLARIPYADAVRFCLLYSLSYFLLIVPLQFLWWNFLGLFTAG
ncbi:MAG: SLC13 family permease, partial [Alphaproteobacteria bacterium]